MHPSSRSVFLPALLLAVPLFAAAVVVLPHLPHLFGGGDVVLTVESPYQNLYVTRQGDVVTLRAGSLYARSSALDLADPYRHVIEYTGLMMLALGYTEDPEEFLVLGLGGGTVTRYLRRYYPDARITNVELDPEVVEIARKHFGFRTDPRMTVVVEDARRFLSRSAATYDVIFLDAYRGDYIPFHLLTREFLELVRGRLREGGVVAANTWSSQQLYRRESATYAAVFGTFDSYLGRKSTNRIVVATRDGAEIPYPELRRRMARVQGERGFAELDLPTLLERHLDRDLSWPADTPILVDDYAPVNFLVEEKPR